MRKTFDAFISYGRVDSKEFATKLQACLEEQGLRVWFDFDNIPLGVDFQNQIDDGIETASHFLFIISPHSVNSPYCRKEIELAIKYNKRIIPLLHVEQINRQIWQQRNPNGTTSEWEAYITQGKHTSFQNIHPTIGKINWVYFREGIDDFQKSLLGLIALLEHHCDYVENHTKFLIKALEWERNQKQTSYLLTGEEKQQAEDWLKIHFKEEQPPCLPSDLHCEYITESIKNSDNLMTQVFLSYAHEDKVTMEKIRRSLRRESITVWTNTTDIQTGESFSQAIYRGIEQADNVVYLLSPDAIKSTYCQQELELAVSLNKRIIPILVRETETTQMQSELRDLQYIDLTDNLKYEDYLLDESQLIKILYQNAAYYKEHKILLTKALKWQQQQKNPSILLRGYNLRSAETWLNLAQKRTQHPPTLLQSEFILASLQQPPLEFLDVFISYSRADSDFARHLNDSLQIQGKTTWFDQESIAAGSDFQQEIYQGIQACDNFVFILSPRSINSPYCQDEVEYAASLNKRFVTVLHQQIETRDLHPELAKVQWIDFHSNERDFNTNFHQLVRSLDTDREHIRSHSKWSQRALEWQSKGKTNDLLLRGSEFLIAHNWLQETVEQNKKPAITDHQQAFIQASQNAIEIADSEENRRQIELLRLQEEKTKEAEARLAEQKKSAKRQTYFLTTISVGLVAAIGCTFWAINQTEIAKQAHKDQLNSVSQFALLLSQNNLKFDALLEAIRVGKEIQKIGQEANPKTRSLVLTALQTAVYENGFREQNRLTKHQGTVFDVVWSPDGKTIATASGDSTVRLWNLNGKEIQKTKVRNNNEVYSISFSPKGKTIVFASDEDIGLWNIEQGTIQYFTGHQQAIRTVSFSMDGEKIVSASMDGIIQIWQLNGEKFETLKSFKCCPDEEGISRVNFSSNFSSDGNTIVTVSENKTVKFWSPQGKLLQTLTGNKALLWSDTRSSDGNTIAIVDRKNNNVLKILNKQRKELQNLKGHKGSINSIKFSPDGKTIATASEDNTVRIWQVSSKKLKILKTDNEAETWSISWSPDGNIIATGRKDKSIQLWTKQGKLIPTQMQHNGAVSSLSFSPDGNTLVSGSQDNTIKLWNNKGKFLRNIGEHKATVWSLAWSPDGNTIASGSQDNTIKLWTKQGKNIPIQIDNKAKIWSVSWSPKGDIIASGSGNNAIQIWNQQGNFIQELIGHYGRVWSVAWSPDGDTIASASYDNTIKLWSQKGEEMKTLTGHENDVRSVTFSPNGETIASASKDHTIKLWNQHGEELQTLNGHSQGLTSLSFSPDGKTLASACNGKTLILWNLEDLDLETLLQDACNQVKDYLEYNAPNSDRYLCKNMQELKLMQF